MLSTPRALRIPSAKSLLVPAGIRRATRIPSVRSVTYKSARTTVSSAKRTARSITR